MLLDSRSVVRKQPRDPPAPVLQFAKMQVRCIVWSGSHGSICKHTAFLLTTTAALVFLPLLKYRRGGVCSAGLFRCPSSPPGCLQGLVQKSHPKKAPEVVGIPLPVLFRLTGNGRGEGTLLQVQSSCCWCPSEMHQSQVSASLFVLFSSLHLLGSGSAEIRGLFAGQTGARFSQVVGVHCSHRRVLWKALWQMMGVRSC